VPKADETYLPSRRPTIGDRLSVAFEDIAQVKVGEIVSSTKAELEKFGSSLKKPSQSPNKPL